MNGIKNRNYTIDILRLLMAIFIVALHSNPFAEYNAVVSYFPSQVISRLGVPFFASIAGYYFFKNKSEKKYPKMLFRYFQTSVIWSGIYFLYLITVGRETEIGGYESLRHMLSMFFLTGFYHLWYMLAIMYTVIILWALSKLYNAEKYLYYISFIFLLLGVLMFGYGKLFFTIPLIQNTFGKLNADINMQTQWIFLVIPFFMMGYGLSKKNIAETHVYKKCELFLSFSLLAYFTEVLVLQVIDIKCSTTLCLFTYPVVYLLLIFAIKRPKIGNAKLAQYAAGIASFMYFGHILFVLILQKLEISETSTYFITVIITAILGAVIVKLDNTILNKLI